MLIKPREMPLQLLKLQALRRRIPENHPKMLIVQDHLDRMMAGYKGEQAADYHLSLLQEESHFIFQGLRLEVNQHVFQMDTLVICKTCIVILEIKNMAGSLFFDDTFHQLIRTKEQKEETFPDPVLQVHRQKMLLKQWLNKHGIPDIPIVSFVVFSHPTATIRTTPDNQHLHHEVIRSDYIPTKMGQIKTKYKEEKLTDKQVKKLIKLLQKRDQPLDQAILPTFGIQQHELQRGVHCPNCAYLPINRRHGFWLCPKCANKTKDAHIYALVDYDLLISHTITNTEMRQFLQIESDALAKRLLKSMELDYSGDCKGRIYNLTFNHVKKLTQNLKNCRNETKFTKI